MNSNPSSEERLRKELRALGAREFEIVALTLDVSRGLAALEYALSQNASHPISYAIKVFDNPEWSPSGQKARIATNVAVEVRCAACGGDRFVAVTDDPSTLYGESYAPCATCNADADTTFWRVDGTRVHTAAR